MVEEEDNALLRLFVCHDCTSCTCQSRISSLLPRTYSAKTLSASRLSSPSKQALALEDDSVLSQVTQQRLACLPELLRSAPWSPLSLRKLTCPFTSTASHCCCCRCSCHLGFSQMLASVKSGMQMCFIGGLRSGLSCERCHKGAARRVSLPRVRPFRVRPCPAPKIGWMLWGMQRTCALNFAAS